jgi:CBS domain containing-hemolysin-like protein
MTGEIAVFLLAVLLSMVCNATETAYSAAGRIRITTAAHSGNRLAGLASWFLRDPSRYLSTTLVGTNVGIILASSLSSGWFARLSPGYETLSVVVTAAFLLVFTEIVPKQNALLRADSLTPPLAPVLVVLRVLFFPIIVSAGFISRIIAGRPSVNRLFESRGEVRSLLEMSGGSEGKRAWDAIELGEKSIRFHARPVSDFPRITLGASRQQAVQRIIESGSDFLLVVEGEGRPLSGVLESRAVLKSTGSWNPGRMLTGIPAFPEDSVPLKVLLDMWRSGAGAAVVLDDRGQPGGIVALGDVLDCLLSEGSSCAPLD